MATRYCIPYLLTIIGVVAFAAAAAQAGPPTPQKIFAVSQIQPGGASEIPGAPSDSVLFYDVTDVGGAFGGFNNDPLFAVWMGFEIFTGEADDTPQGNPAGNREEFSALTFNPANGTIYAAAFDSGSAGFPDDVGDTQGDFDFYRINYQQILDDFQTNSRPRGTVYAPKTLTITNADEQFLESISSPLFDGTVDGLANDVPHPSGVNTVHLDGAFTKIGELGRTQPPTFPGGSFFDTEIDFVDPETIIVLDTASGLNTAGDFQIRQWKRVSTSPGAAVLDANGADDVTGPPGFAGTADDHTGGNNGNTFESWEASILGRLELDAGGNVESNPAGWALVNNGDTLGVWVADSDGADDGDDVAFYEIDLSGPTPTATRKTLGGTGGGNSFQVDQDPSVDATTDDGTVDFLQVDRNGNLVIGESGFFDDPQEEPKVITVGIENYDAAGEVASTGYAASGNTNGFDSTTPYTVSANTPISGANDNDPDVTNSTRVAYDQSTGYVYIIDQDTGFTEDIYVFDPATGTIVYSEFNPFDIGIFNAGTQIVFTRGDINGDGIITYDDVQRLEDAIDDPTLGGTESAALIAEWYDLTNDGTLTSTDLDEMVVEILGTALGDFDLNGEVNAVDEGIWENDFGASKDGRNFLQWQRNLGFTNMPPQSSAVPEPTAVVIAVLFACGFASKRLDRNE